MQITKYLHNVLRRDMQMTHIIYERLCLPPSAPITYKEFPPPPPRLSSEPNWHNLHYRDHTLGDRSRPQRGLLAWVLWLGGKSYLAD